MGCGLHVVELARVLKCRPEPGRVWALSIGAGLLAEPGRSVGAAGHRAQCTVL